MNVLNELKQRFRGALSELVDDPDELLEMIRPAQDPKFGDYQANCAMPLGKRLGKPPREVAQQIVSLLKIDDLCCEPEIAGPGFINLRLHDDWLIEQLHAMGRDDRLAVTPVSEPRTYVIDYSSPNVAKPMHVGHVRSTVIGDALCRTLRFLGHKVISDNHLGDWGTQFGMIIYGYKHFVVQASFDDAPVPELGRLYKLVNQLVEYHNAKTSLPKLEAAVDEQARQLEQQRESLPDESDKSALKKARKSLRRQEERLQDARNAVSAAQSRVQAVESVPDLQRLAAEHPDIATAVLQETAKLHEGDKENRELWDQFLPYCRDEIQRVYDRLDIQFDVEYGESFYQDRLAAVVSDFETKGVAQESDGAICIFLDGFDAPMIIRKKDGAFLYATTDLATIQYRMAEWSPDAMLYVVDHRQSEHFEKLFAAARIWGCSEVELNHIAFGTVLGKDGKPYKTRSGDTVGLEGLLDESVNRALEVVSSNDDSKPTGPELSESERRHIADVVGHAAIKYADLSHNRTSDYEFSYDKMVALEGNTATYMQYSYARTQSIFRKGDVDAAQLWDGVVSLSLTEPMERAMALELLRFGQAIEDVVADYRPNQMTAYLFSLAGMFSKFYNDCPVLKAESQDVRDSRLLLCDLAGRVIRQGLSLLGIGVVEKM